MERNNGRGSSKHQNAKHENVVPEVSNNGKHDNSDLEGASSLDNQNEHIEATSVHDKMVGDAPSTSFSSSSSSSNLLDVDYDEKDALDVSFSSSEKDDSGSTRVDSESQTDISTTTPQWSMVSGSPLAGPIAGPSLSPEVPPQTSGLIIENASPKQSPAIQVMRRPTGYDPNRIPSSLFAPKPTNTTEWSVASNESLFSIQMGKSGELNRPDDWLNYPCFTNDVYKSNELTGFLSGLPTVIETSENEQKSASSMEPAEKEDLREIQSQAPIDSINENEKLYVSDRKGANAAGPCNSGSTLRLSDESGNTASSFAFPVIGGASSLKSDSETPLPPPTQSLPQGNAVGKTKSCDHVATPKAGGNRWFNCFSCCALCG